MPFSSDGYLYDEKIGEKYPFLMKYFKNGIENTEKNIAHCILFYGNDIEAQYDLAIEIARLLNCAEGGSQNCSCRNCNWVRSNQHPAVLTYSRFDNRTAEDKNKVGISISIDQAREIKNSLMISTAYHRVLIFCDKDKDGNLGAINRQNFPDGPANTLLKTFEEPPSNTTFIFLTKDKSEVISTVVSRSQCFFVPSQKDEPQDFSLVQKVMDGYLELERSEVLDFYEAIYLSAKDNGIEVVLNQMQNYIAALLKNADNGALKVKLLHDFNAIEKAKSEARLNMNIQTVLETLSFEMIL